MFVFCSKLYARVLVIKIVEEKLSVGLVFKDDNEVVNVSSVKEGFEVGGTVIEPNRFMVGQKDVCKRNQIGEMSFC